MLDRAFSKTSSVENLVTATAYAAGLALQTSNRTAISFLHVVGAGGAIPVVINFDPSTAKMRTSVRRDINHVGMLLLSVHRILTGQREILLGRLVPKHFDVIERRLDLAVHEKNNLIIRRRQLIDPVMAAAIRFDDPLLISIFCLDVHFGTSHRLPF